MILSKLKTFIGNHTISHNFNVNNSLLDISTIHRNIEIIRIAFSVFEYVKFRNWISEIRHWYIYCRVGRLSSIDSPYVILIINEDFYQFVPDRVAFQFITFLHLLLFFVSSLNGSFFVLIRMKLRYVISVSMRHL